MGVGKGVVSEAWSDADRESLRVVIAPGSTTAAAAVVLGRTPGATAAMANKLGLTTWASVTASRRDAIVEHGRLGWSSSRIAKRFGVPVEAVDAWTGRTAS